MAKSDELPAPSIGPLEANADPAIGRTYSPATQQSSGHELPRIGSHHTPLDDDVERTVVNELDTDEKVLDAVFRDRFEYREELGRGAFGQVWHAYDRQLQRPVAIKVSRSVEGDGALLLREARAMSRLRHPNIVRVLDSGRCGQGWYIVSELIPGTSLRDRMQTEKIPIDRAVTWVSQLARALDAAHAKGVIHRDVKPTNILIDEHDQPQLVDFGLALRTRQETVASRERAAGTPAYMAPEQARGDESAISPRSDIYSLGVVLFELLAGRRPFDGDSKELMQQVAFQAAPRLRTVAPNIPVPLAAICDKALARDPRDRFESAGEMASELQRYLEGNSSLPGSPVAWSDRRRLVPAFAMATAVAAAAWAGWSFSNRGDRIAEVPKPEDLAKRVVPLPPMPKEISVVLNTDPQGARLTWIPHDPETHRLDPKRKRTSQAGAATMLEPGYYVVEAVWPTDGIHHEVHRTVPGGLTATLPQSPSHSFAKQEDGTVRLPGIREPANQPLDRTRMAQIEGGEFTAGGEKFGIASPRPRVTIDRLWIDQRELSVHDWNANSTIEPLWIEGGVDETSNVEVKILPPDINQFAVAGIQPLDALRVAEKLGKSLPSYEEWQYVATAGGKRDFPWGNERPPEIPWPGGTYEERAVHDTTHDDAQLIGLFSGPAEITQTLYYMHPAARTMPAPVPQLFMAKEGNAYFGWGGPVFLTETAAANWNHCSLGPEPVDTISAFPNLGLRLVIREQPRFTESVAE